MNDSNNANPAPLAGVKTGEGLSFKIAKEIVNNWLKKFFVIEEENEEPDAREIAKIIHPFVADREAALKYKEEVTEARKMYEKNDSYILTEAKLFAQIILHKLAPEKFDLPTKWERDNLKLVIEELRPLTERIYQLANTEMARADVFEFALKAKEEEIAKLGNKYFMDGVDSDAKIESLESQLKDKDARIASLEAKLKEKEGRV